MKWGFRVYCGYLCGFPYSAVDLLLTDQWQCCPLPTGMHCIGWITTTTNTPYNGVLAGATLKTTATLPISYCLLLICIKYIVSTDARDLIVTAKTSSERETFGAGGLNFLANVATPQTRQKPGTKTTKVHDATFYTLSSPVTETTCCSFISGMSMSRYTCSTIIRTFVITKAHS